MQQKDDYLVKTFLTGVHGRSLNDDYLSKIIVRFMTYSPRKNVIDIIIAE